MKRKIFTFLLVLGVAWSLHSCDNNDDESIAVPVELQSTFSAKYPNATNVTSWQVHFNTLPDPVKNTIHATYPGRVDDDDTEYVEEATGATYYLIDIENSEIDVKIRADGQILD